MDGPDPKLGGANRVATDVRSYDANGRLVRVEDAVGYQIDTTWTADGLQDTVTGRQPGGGIEHQQTTTYDANGRPIADAMVVDDTRVDTTTTSYYADGLKAEQVNPQNPTKPTAARNTYRWAYDGVGNPTSVWSPSAIAMTDLNNGANLPVRHYYTRDNLLAQTVEPVASDGSTYRATVYGV